MQPVRSHRVMRWVNGAGVTHEVAAWPSAERWELRVSIADIERDAPFSSLPGVDRWLVQLRGGPMALHLDTGATDLERFVPLAFDGGRPARVELSGEAGQVMNVMRRRDLAPPVELRVDRHERGDRIDLDDALIAIVLDGVLRAVSPSEVFPYNETSVRVDRGDALFPTTPDDPAAVHAVTTAVVATLRLAPR